MEIILFAVGLFFLVMEILVIPGMGLAGILGLVLIVISIFMASQDFLLPHSTRQWNQFLTMLVVFGTSLVGFIIAAVVITRRIGSLPVLNRLVLAPPDGGADRGESGKPTGLADVSPLKPGPVVHPDVSVGDWGRTESPLRPAGRAVFAGRSFDVVSDGIYVDSGVAVKVIHVEGTRIVVVPVEENRPAE